MIFVDKFKINFMKASKLIERLIFIENFVDFDIDITQKEWYEKRRT